MNIYDEISSALRNARREADGTISGEAVFPPEFAGFKGHFPDKAIVPGVCLLEAAGLLLEKVLGRKFKFGKALSVKFLNVVQPNELIQFKIKVDEKEGKVIANSKVFKGDKSVSVSKIEFEIE
jgi:3-hydroxyacyl-[acyl-carrier-protein] dehydratase